MEERLKQYISNINRIYSSGEYTEHSFRGEFCSLCEDLLNGPTSNNGKGNLKYRLINEPKRKEYGAPDYEVIKGDNTVAFIEAKNIGETDLRGENKRKNKEQFDRYKNAISTIAFTDYLTIILYEDGEETISSTIGKVVNGKIVFNEDEEQIDNLSKILQKIGQASPKPITNARSLAEKMARKARLVATILNNAMKIKKENRSPEDKDLWGKLETFQKHLVHDMTSEQFVDFYAQTILYGLFIARINDKHPETFSLSEAAELIPAINPFLKKIFSELALTSLHSSVKGIVQDLVELFRISNMERVLKKYRKDPLVHFYEDFLESYNPKIREQFGVWYTPIQVVNFIVNSVDEILSHKLGIERGLANNSFIEGSDCHRVQILDPATGTGTFLASAIEKIYGSYKGQEGLWENDVVDHIVPRLNGFEYLIAPYTMAHLKLSSALRLESAGNNVPERLNVFLTNSLEEEHPESKVPFAMYISDESNAASRIKRETPVMVVMGNPPYNERSVNTGTWIMNLMDDYKQEPGKEPIRKTTKKGKIITKNTLEEKNAKGINNDYCKFIRLGHNFVKKTKEGILAYICGNTFLKTNIFRGMRYHLLKDFDEVYIINLHGSSKFGEGENDENIFDITVGVSINIFVKYKDSPSDGLAKIFYKDIFGTRKEKLEYLGSHTLENMEFEEITPDAPYYELTPKSDDHEELKAIYQEGFRLDDLIPQSVQGFKTEKDKIAISETKKGIENLIADMVSPLSDNELREKYGFKDSRDWKLDRSRQNLRLQKNRETYVSQVCYRPFDNQWSYLNKNLVSYPRPKIQQSMMEKQNLVLCLGKQGSAIGNAEWSLVYISTLPTDMNVNPRGGAYLFPLYLYQYDQARMYNFNEEVIRGLEVKTALSLQPENEAKRAEGGFTGEDLIHYIYAVLHSHKYRKKYHAFLQNDFPVIPYPSNAEYFFNMAALGKELRNLHLLSGIEQKDFITQFPVAEGDNIVSKRKFEEIGEGKGRLWINSRKYFDNVPKEAWEIFISGYQPLDKWLKDRNGKELSGNDIRHIQKMIVALKRTDEVMNSIDEIIRF